MIKRPIFALAMVLAMAVAVVFFAFPDLIIQTVDFNDHDKVTAAGIVYMIENRSDGKNIYLKNVSVSGDGGSKKYTGIKKAVLYIPDDEYEDNIRIGNQISADSVFRSFRTARNYGNFDEEGYYRSLGICFKAEADEIRIIDDNVFLFNQFMSEIGNRMTSAIYSAVDDDETAGILNAICTGDKSGLTDETKTIYRQSGIVHILAISGLHISMIGMTLFRLLRKKLRFMSAASIASVLMIGFCMISHASPSALRATIMFMVQLISIGLGKTYDLLCSVSLAAILILAAEPCYIGHSGFQLSFLAILSVGIVGKAVNRFLRTESKLLSGLVVSAGIFIVSVPVTAAMYYELPLYSILLNLIVIPVMSFVLGAGMLAGLCGMINFLIGRFISGLGVYIIKFIELLCRINRYLPWNTVITGKPDNIRIVIFYLILAAGCIFLNVYSADRGLSQDKLTSGKKRMRAASLAIIAVLLLIFLFGGKKSDKLKITMIDVGQGDCILVQSPAGRTYLIDGGSTSEMDVGKYRISGAVKYYGVSRIDIVFITHPDKDHYSGILDLMENKDYYGISIGQICTPSLPENENYQQIAAAAGENDIEMTDIRAGMELNDGMITIRCIHPDKNYSSDNINGYSAVLDIRYGEFSALFTGDIETAEEEMILNTASELFPADGYDLLKTAHHGSKNSSSLTFLEAVKSGTAIISAGVNNSYGHPHAETVDRLLNTGAAVYCTKEVGEIIIEAGKNGEMDIDYFIR